MPADIAALEKRIDGMTAQLPPMKSFYSAGRACSGFIHPYCTLRVPPCGAPGRGLATARAVCGRTGDPVPEPPERLPVYPGTLYRTTSWMRRKWCGNQSVI